MAEPKQGKKQEAIEATTGTANKTAAAKASAPRKIPGNLPYLAASGTLKKALIGLIDASRPDKFNPDFLSNVLKLNGGSARATIPILKKMGFLSSAGVPTERYGKFRTVGGRPAAAFAGLRDGFSEIFKRSEYAHTVDDNKLRDIITEITGLNANDHVVQAIKSTFNSVKSFIPAGADLKTGDDDGSFLDEPADVASNQSDGPGDKVSKGSKPVGLVYNINIVLPETSDLKVLNAIFRSVKENLL